MGLWLLRLSAKILAFLPQPRSQGSLLPALRSVGRVEPWERGCFYRYRLIFSVTVNKKLKINFFCFKELNINRPDFFLSSKEK